MAFTYKDKKYTKSDAVNRAEAQRDENSRYTESASVKNYESALKNIENNKVPDWNGGSYGSQMNDVLNKILNRDKFSYDLNSDALYQQYKDMYMTQGKQAMADTIGKASALTGGYANSYAQSAGNQAYQSYLQQLNNIVPELYQLALSRYNQEGADLQNQYGLLTDRYNTEYGEYADAVSRYNAERDYAANMYNNERSFDYGRFADDRNYYNDLYNNELNRDYTMWSDAYNRAFNEYQQQLSEQQTAQQLALEKERLAASSKSTSGTGGKSSSMKTPTSAMYEKALKLYKTEGDAGLSRYIDSVGDEYDKDLIMQYAVDHFDLEAELIRRLKGIK